MSVAVPWVHGRFHSVQSAGDSCDILLKIVCMLHWFSLF